MINHERPEIKLSPAQERLIGVVDKLAVNPADAIDILRRGECEAFPGITLVASVDKSDEDEPRLHFVLTVCAYPDTLEGVLEQLWVDRITAVTTYMVAENYYPFGFSESAPDEAIDSFLQRYKLE